MSTFEVKQLRREIPLESGEMVVEVEPAVKSEQVGQEPDPAVEMGETEVKQASQEIDEVVRLNKPELQVLSEMEKRDIEMTTKTPGWELYWRNRLTPELDILPEDVKPVVEKLIHDLRLSSMEDGIFKAYVYNRIGSLHKREPITKIQHGKKLEMERLKQRLNDIDTKKDYQEVEKINRKTVYYDKGSDLMFVLENDTPKKITVGDIAADYDWGIKYRPDNTMPDNLWRKIRKLSDYTEAKRNIEDLFNREIVITEILLSGKKGVSLLSAGVGFSFDKILRLSQHMERGVVGYIAERMVPNFLSRLQYNNPNLGFKMEHSNVLEDAYLKYDFKINFSSKLRGVAIEGDDMPREDYIDQKRKFGIQFTIRPKGFGKKNSQIEKGRELISESSHIKYVKKRVDDIVLMSVPFGNYEKSFQRWVIEGQPSGGPEQYMSLETKKTLIKKAFQGRIELTDEQIEKLASE